MSLNSHLKFLTFAMQSKLAIRNGLIRNKLESRNHFLQPICHLLHKNKELLALRNNFRATKKFLITNFDCIFYWCNLHKLIALMLNNIRVGKRKLKTPWYIYNFTYGSGNSVFLPPSCLIGKDSCISDRNFVVILVGILVGILEEPISIRKSWKIGTKGQIKP